MITTKKQLKNLISEIINEQNASWEPDMQISAKFGVDAGNISVYDYAYIRSVGGKWEEDANLNCKRIKLPSGLYKVEYDVNGWRGMAKGFKNIQTSGEIIIGDICYLFPDSVHHKWSAFLEKTNYLRTNGKFGFSVDTGGDGLFKAKFKFFAIE